MIPRALNIRILALAGLVAGIAVVAVIGVRRLQASADDPPPPPQWQYTTAGAVRTASLQSRNILKQPAPFKGGPATLSLARGPDGYVARLDVDGDMACSYAPTASKVEVSFDGAAPQAFACAPAPEDHGALLFDGKHSTAYFADPIAFLARVRNARHVRIEGEFAGQAAPQAMAFDLPPGDPVAQVSPAVAATGAAPPPVATAVAATDVLPVRAVDTSHRRPAVVRASLHMPPRRHPAGYYLHPYRPLPRPATPRRVWRGE